MMQGWPGKDRKIEHVIRHEDGLYLISQRGRLRLCPMNETMVRVTYTERENFSTKAKPGILCSTDFKEWDFEENPEYIVLKTSRIKVEVNREYGSCRYLTRDGRVLLKERHEEPRSLEEFWSYRLAAGAEIKTEKVQTVDGEKTLVREAVKEQDELLYHTRLHLEWQEQEALYGLGQHEEGVLNLRGHMVYLHQANRKIAIPMLVSSRGYGILVDTYAPMIFSDTEYGSYLYTEADREMDFYFIYGESMDGVVRGYRQLTGKASMLPKWAFGYIQSQERYETQEEICTIAKEYRKRGIGLDALVLDWSSWEDGMWGQKTFDASRFPTPGSMTAQLHQRDIHFMISIWPNMSENSDNYREMKEQGLLLPGSDIYNALSAEGRQLYWKQTREGLYCHGIDGWWCDSSEPFTPEWTHRERTEPAIMYTEYCKNAENMVPASATNSYALYHARALYEGQRGEDERAAKPGKRVVNLTRSAWTGQQRYGAILWSGDTDASWSTLRKQIPAGLNFSASGLPYWTTDIGAFFVRRGDLWYWKGDYNQGYQDPGYRELMTRWYQWGAFLPVFRGHGTDFRRELWLYGEEGAGGTEGGNLFYDAMLAVNRLRYRLMPYIYSQAGRVWLLDESMMKPLVFDYPEDTTVFDIRDQYLFGQSLMVCPVTKPMYYGRNSQRLEGVSLTRPVYLPRGNGWYDFWTDKYYEGGQWIEAEAPIDRIPLYVKEGSILPMAEASDRVQTREEITYTVYGGGDASYRLYQDEGDGYGYELGAYCCTDLYWSETEKTLRDDKGRKYEFILIEKGDLI